MPASPRPSATRAARTSTAPAASSRPRSSRLMSIVRTARRGSLASRPSPGRWTERADRLPERRLPSRYSGTPTAPRKDPLVSTSFERVSRFSVGYDMREVDDFLARARTAYEGRDPEFSGADITSASFGTERGGYDMRVVDEALD